MIFADKWLQGTDDQMDRVLSMTVAQIILDNNLPIQINADALAILSSILGLGIIV